MALEHGVDLVPIYCFGDSDTYRIVSNSTVRSLQHYIVAKFRIALPLCWGAFFLMPLSRPLHLVVGEPLHVDLVENPSPAQITALHVVCF